MFKIKKVINKEKKKYNIFLDIGDSHLCVMKNSKEEIEEIYKIFQFIENALETNFIDFVKSYNKEKYIFNERNIKEILG